MPSLKDSGDAQACENVKTHNPDLNFQIAEKNSGQRLDKFLVKELSEFNRSSISKLIKKEMVLVKGLPVKAGYKIRLGDTIEIFLPPPERSSLQAERLDLDILFEDEAIIVLNKAPGIVVHPGAGNRTGTIANGLLYHCATLPGIEDERPGIVHRLDKDTSGVLLVAKDEKSQRRLMGAFKDRAVKKIYHAILQRCPFEEEGRIIEPVGRHPVNRKKMAIRKRSGRYAATNWKIIERYDNGFALAQVHIETGRTHQIRVHMSSINAPVAGDSLYGGKVSGSLGDIIERQMLHASSLTFNHPTSQSVMTVSAPFPQDFQLVLETLRSDC